MWSTLRLRYHLQAGIWQHQLAIQRSHFAKRAQDEGSESGSKLAKFATEVRHSTHAALKAQDQTNLCFQHFKDIFGYFQGKLSAGFSSKRWQNAEKRLIWYNAFAWIRLIALEKFSACSFEDLTRRKHLRWLIATVNAYIARRMQTIPLMWLSAKG